MTIHFTCVVFLVVTAAHTIDHPNSKDHKNLKETFCELVHYHQSISSSMHRDGNEVSLLLCNSATTLKESRMSHLHPELTVEFSN